MNTVRNPCHRASRTLCAALGLFLGAGFPTAEATAQAGPFDGATAFEPGSRAGTTTVHFVGIPLRSALQLIAEQGHFNLVVSDAVVGTVSLRLVDVTWEQVLDVVLKLKHLRMRIDGATRTVDLRDGP